MTSLSFFNLGVIYLSRWRNERDERENEYNDERESCDKSKNNEAEKIRWTRGRWRQELAY